MPKNLLKKALDEVRNSATSTRSLAENPALHHPEDTGYVPPQYTKGQKYSSQGAIRIEMKKRIITLEKAILFVDDISEISGCPREKITNISFCDKKGNPTMIDKKDIYKVINKYSDSIRSPEKTKEEVEKVFGGKSNISLTSAYNFITARII